MLPGFLRFSLGLLRTKCAQICLYRGIRVSIELHRRYYRPPIKFSKRKGAENISNFVQRSTEEAGFEESQNDKESYEFQKFVEEEMRIPRTGHGVLVIQPFVKWRSGKTRSAASLLLEESVTLIKTLRDWKVVDQMTLSVKRLDAVHIFGPGQMEDLVKKIRSNTNITAVFISTKILRPVQHEILQNAFGVPVYDRYTVVIHIFREHATTKESRLQVKLAELPYLKSRLKGIGRGLLRNFGGGAAELGTVWKGKEFHEQLFKEREAKIKAEINKLREHREIIRKSRIKNEIPIIAVVGYTNSGKTSLIKALTGKEKLEPKDYLFATLEVTVHEGILPSSMRVLFLDTVGFMSDIPTVLFESFLSTLEDTRLADIIIHVRDLSHPDTSSQNENVKETLQLLELPDNLLNNMITVGNKIDKLLDEELENFKDGNIIFISALKMIGTDYLLQMLEESLLKTTDRKIIMMRVKTGGDEYCWLQENAVIIEESQCTANIQYTMMKIIITEINLAKFKHKFIKDYFKSNK